MIHDDSLVMIEKLKIWVKERFRALQSASSDGENDAAKARYREVVDVIRRLEKLQVPVPEEIRSEKAALEEFLYASNEDENQLTILAKELSSLAKNIRGRLQDIRHQKTPRGSNVPPKQLRVEFPDGTIACENKATDTFVQVLDYIGLKRVSELPIKRFGCPLVSTRKQESASMYLMARELNGYFIQTTSSTDQKAKFIQRIAKKLDIKITVNILDY